MHFSSWLAFLSVALVTSFSPGPAILLAISNSVNHGAKQTLMSSAGNVCGQLLLAIVTMLGLGAALKASAALFVVVKTLGAIYLIYLGIKQWRKQGSMPLPSASLQGSEKSATHLFREGLVVALTNPKSILFFTALFPQFLTPSGSFIREFSLLTVTFVACTMLSHSVYLLLAARMRGLFSKPKAATRINKISGAIFVAFGVGLLTLRRPTA